MLKRLALYVMIFVSQAGNTKVPFFLSKEIVQQHKGLCIDKQENFYTFNESGFVKYNKEGTKQKEYKSPEVGDIICMDINPAGHIALLSKDVATIQILDKNFIEIGKLKLEEINISNITFCAFANDGNLLLYNNQERTVMKTDFTGNIKQRATKLVIYPGQSFNPIDFNEDENELCFTDSIEGVFIFDNYGKQKQKINEKNIYHIQQLNKQLIYFKGETLYVVDKITKATKEIKIELGNNLLKHAAILGEKIITGDERKIFIYELSKN